VLASIAMAINYIGSGGAQVFTTLVLMTGITSAIPYGFSALAQLKWRREDNRSENDRQQQCTHAGNYNSRSSHAVSDEELRHFVAIAVFRGLESREGMIATPPRGFGCCSR